MWLGPFSWEMADGRLCLLQARSYDVHIASLTVCLGTGNATAEISGPCARKLTTDVALPFCGVSLHPFRAILCPGRLGGSVMLF